MSRDLLPAPEVPRPERFRLHTESSESTGEETATVLAEDSLGNAGSCRVARSRDIASILSVEVSERAAGSGLDAALVATGLQWAEIHGAESAVVELEEDEDGARVFRRLGFMLETSAGH